MLYVVPKSDSHHKSQQQALKLMMPIALEFKKSS